MIHRLGKAGEVPVDGAKALERFTYGCDRDYPNSCYYLSVMYLQGRVAGWLLAGRSRFTTPIHFQGKPPPVDKDMLKALQYAEKACEFNHPWACVNAARMLATGLSSSC